MARTKKTNSCSTTTAMSLLPFLFLLLLLLLLLLLQFAVGYEESVSSSAVTAAPPTSLLPAKCSNDITSLTDCLSYSTGKSDNPSDKCCRTVSDIRRKDPVCLCYVIQQTHNASSQTIYNMGLQIGRLIQLPAACKIHNANVTDCPGLLGLPSDSPDNALFNGSATPATATNATAGNTTTTTATTSFGHGVDCFRNFNSALVYVFLSCVLFLMG